MRHNVRGRKLGRNASHRKAMFRNMVTSLFRHERIETTTQKAKECRGLAERLITYAKAGDLNSRRMAARKLYDPVVLQKLFDDIGPRFKDRPGGYTRVLKIDGRRHGDNAETAILELVGNEIKSKAKKPRKKAEAAEEPKKEPKQAAATTKKTAKKATKKAAKKAVEEVVVEDVVVEDVVEDKAD